MQRQFIAIAGVELELFEAGDGPPILLLHDGGSGFVPEHPYVALLSERQRLIAPSHPGFGKSSLPDWIDAVDDIAYIYLELIDRLGLDKVDVIGCQFGGWIAAELATKTPAVVRHLVLSAPPGCEARANRSVGIPGYLRVAAKRAGTVDVPRSATHADGSVTHER